MVIAAGLLTQTATIIRRAVDSVDALGAPVWDDTDTDTVACKLDPGTADDTWPPELIGQTVGQLYLEGDPAVGAHDLVTVDGRTWRPVGVAVGHYGRTAATHHTSIRVAAFDPPAD